MSYRLAGLRAAAVLSVFAAWAAPPAVSLAKFTLTEKPGDVRRLFQEEPHAVTTAAEHVLKFHGRAHSAGCDETTQWVFYFSRRENRLVSVTRNVEEPATLAELIPRGVQVQRFRTARGYPVLRAKLADGREFVAAGARSLRDRVSQVQLVRSVDVGRFYGELQPED